MAQRLRAQNRKVKAHKAKPAGLLAAHVLGRIVCLSLSGSKSDEKVLPSDSLLLYILITSAVDTPGLGYLHFFKRVRRTGKA